MRFANVKPRRRRSASNANDPEPFSINEKKVRRMKAKFLASAFVLACLAAPALADTPTDPGRGMLPQFLMAPGRYDTDRTTGDPSPLRSHPARSGVWPLTGGHHDGFPPHEDANGVPFPRV